MTIILQQHKAIEIWKFEFRKKRIESAKLQGYSTKLKKNWKTEFR